MTLAGVAIDMLTMLNKKIVLSKKIFILFFMSAPFHSHISVVLKRFTVVNHLQQYLFQDVTQ
jgi:hypothetical protein